MPVVYDSDIPNIERHSQPAARRPRSRQGRVRPESAAAPAAHGRDVRRQPRRRGGGGFVLFFVTFVAAVLIFLAIWPDPTFEPRISTTVNSDHTMAPDDQTALSLEAVAGRVWEAARDRFTPLVPAGRALIDDLVQQGKRAERYVRRTVGRIAEMDTGPARSPAN